VFLEEPRVRWSGSLDLMSFKAFSKLLQADGPALMVPSPYLPVLATPKPRLARRRRGATTALPLPIGAAVSPPIFDRGGRRFGPLSHLVMEGNTQRTRSTTDGETQEYTATRSR